MGNIPGEEPEDGKEETVYTGPDYGQKGTNLQPPPDSFQEEEVDYQQRGAGHPSSAGHEDYPGGGGYSDAADDSGEAR